MDPEKQREFEESLRAVQDMINGLGTSLSNFNNSIGAITNSNNKTVSSNNQTAQSANNLSGANSKLQQAYAQAEQDIGKSSKSLKAGFDNLGTATLGVYAAFGSFTKSMLSAQEGFGKYSNSIGQLGDAVSGVVKDVKVLGIPLGAAFAGVTKILTGVMGDALKLGDQMISLRDTVAGTAGALPVTTTELVKLSSNAKYFGENMEKLAKITAGLGQNLTSLGQTAGQGSTKMMELAAVTDRTRNEFRNLGYSQEQLTKLQSDYVSTLAQSGNAYALQNKSMAQLRKESLDYALQINRLSSLTGKSADQLEEEKQQIARARGFQLYAMQEQEKAAQLRSEGRADEAAQVEKALADQVTALQQVSATLGPEVALRVGEALRTPGGITPGSVGLANMAPGALENLLGNIQAGKAQEGGLQFAKEYGLAMRSNIGQTQGIQELLSPETLNQLGFYESAVSGEVTRGAGSDLLKSLGVAKTDQEKRMSGVGDQVAQTLNNLKNAELQLQEAYQNFLIKILPDVSNGLVMVAEQLPALANKAQELWDKMGGLSGIVDKLALAFAGLAAVSVVGPIVSGIIGGILAGGLGRLGGALLGGGAGGAGAAGAAGGGFLRGAVGLAGRAAPWLSGLMVGKDAYDWATAEGPAKKEDVYGTVGGVLGGAVGLLGGPVGVAIGAGLGNMLGNWLGSSEDEATAKPAAAKLAAAKSTAAPGAPGTTTQPTEPNSAERLIQQNLQTNYLQAVLDNTEVLKKVNTNLNSILGKETETETGAPKAGPSTDKLEESLNALAATVNMVTLAMGGTPPSAGGGANAGPGATFGGDMDRILGTIRAKESGGGNPAGDYKAENPSSTASGAYQFTDGTWRNLTSKYGIGTEWSHAADAPAAVQDQIAAKYIQEILDKAGGDVSKVPLAWYTGNIQGKSSAVTSAQVSSYQSDWMQKFQSMPSSAGGAGSTGGSGLLGAVKDTTGAMQSMGSNITGQNAGSALMLARSMIGANEKKDRNTIMQFLRAGNAGIDPALEAWCAAFVNSSLQQAGIPGSGSAIANSFQNWGTSISGNQVKPGDVVVNTRGLRPGQPGGHVGLATGAFDGSKIWMVAGNTGNKVQEYATPFDKNIMVRRSSMMKAAKGGVFSGPRSGYPMELHGTEMVTPLNQNSLLMELGKMPANLLKSTTAGIKERTMQVTDFQRIVNKMAESQTATANEMINDSTAPLKMLASSIEKSMEKANRSQSEMMNMLSYKIDEMIDSMQTSNKHTKKIMKKAS